MNRFPNVEKISEKYYIQSRVGDAGYIEPPDAKPIAIAGFDEFDLFQHARWLGYKFEPECQIITDAITGQLCCGIEWLIDGKFMRYNYKTECREPITPESLQAVIEAGIKGYGVSPRYKILTQEEAPMTNTPQ